MSRRGERRSLRHRMKKYQGENRRGFLNMQVSLGDVVRVGGMIVTIAGLYYGLREEVRVDKQFMLGNQAVIQAQVSNVADSVRSLRNDVVAWETQIRAEVKEIDRKVDRR